MCPIINSRGLVFQVFIRKNTINKYRYTEIIIKKSFKLKRIMYLIIMYIEKLILISI